MAIPKRVQERLASGIKAFQPILEAARARDVNEADTVTIVKDMLADVFGYDKYAEVTSEFCIRNSYCDLATKIDGEIAALIEVKAIGLELRDQHIKQAVDYAANQGSDWVLLTNAISWRVYRVVFAKPIQHELVIDLDFTKLSGRSETDLEAAYLWCREGWVRSALGEYHSQRQALSRYFLGALVTGGPVLDVLRRELRRVSPDVRIDVAQIQKVLEEEVIKRDVLEGEKADEARRKIGRAAKRLLKATKSTEQSRPEIVDAAIAAADEISTETPN
jgi:hypothetical protein